MKKIFSGQLVIDTDYLVEEWDLDKSTTFTDDELYELNEELMEARHEIIEDFIARHGEGREQ